MKSENKKPKKILIIRTDRLGDVVLSTPVFECVRLWAPEAHIAVMTRPYTRDIIADNPSINESIVYDKYGEHKSIFSTIRFARELKKQHFDLVLILHPTNRVHLIAWLAGIPKRVGWDRKCNYLLTDKLNYKNKTDEKHERDYTLDLLTLAGIPVMAWRLRVYVPDELKFKIKQQLLSYNITHGFVAIHPGASSTSKRWPVEKFASLMQKIYDENKIPSIVVGGSEEKDLGSYLAKTCGSFVKDLTGELSLQELAALFSEAILLVSSDSGPVHVSTAVETPVISIFGRKMTGLGPERWGPLGRDDIALQHDVGCEKCLADECKKGFACLEAVTVDEVYGAIETILSK